MNQNMRNFIVLLSAIAVILSFHPVSHAGEKEDIVLKNSKVELRFSPSGPSFLFKSFQSEGVNVLPPEGSAVHPWEIQLLGPCGENPLLNPRFSYYLGGRQLSSSEAEFVWEIVLESRRWPVTMSVTLEEDSELPVWRIRAGLPDGWLVTSLDFPNISVKRLERAKAILPVGYGVEYDVPVSGNLQSRYPSCTGVMQMVLVHNDAATLYFSSRDRSASNKTFQIRGDGSSVVFSQKIVTSYAWTADGQFELPWGTVLGYCPGTWQNAVTKWYRPFSFSTKWGEKTLKDRKIAPWIKEADIWLRPVDVTEGTMDAVRRGVKMYGKGIGLHWYYWHHSPFDTDYPDYFPEKEGFADMVEEAVSLGAHVTPYINGRLWDTSNHTYKELNGREASCRKPDGTLYTEVYSSKVLNTVTCPASPIWSDVLYGLNESILKDLRTDGVYMDQIGCAASEPCYADGHNHPKGGGGWWPEAYRTLLEDMRDRLYKKNQAMTTEENVECYIDLFDMMLIVNSPHNAYTKMVPLFPVVYSDRCIYSGFTYIPWKLADGSMDYISMKSLLWGAQLGWVDPQILLKPENAGPAEFLKTLSDFRKSQHDIFVGGRFIKEFIPGGDNPVIDIPNYQKTNVVMGSEWESVSGKRACVLVNMGGSDLDVVLPDGRIVSVRARGAARF